MEQHFVSVHKGASGGILSCTLQKAILWSPNPIHDKVTLCASMCFLYSSQRRDTLLIRMHIQSPGTGQGYVNYIGDIAFYKCKLTLQILQCLPVIILQYPQNFATGLYLDISARICRLYVAQNISNFSSTSIVVVVTAGLFMLWCWWEITAVERFGRC